MNKADCFPGRSCCLMDVLAASVVSFLLLSQRCLSAPQVQDPDRLDIVEGTSFTMANPFGSGEQERRLLQSYIKGNLKEGQMSPDLSTWEQEIFFLFSLHDYDRSGQMDGLEMMKLLSDFLSHHSLAPRSDDSVVSMVDILLQTQDLNQDGMLDPSELLSPPMERRSAEQPAPSDALAKPAQDAASEQQEGGAAGQPQVPEHPEQTGVQQEHQGQDVAQELNQQEQEVQEQQKEDGQMQKPQAEGTEELQQPAYVHQGQPEM